MPAEQRRPALYVAIGAAVVLALAAFWLPRWWENREFRHAESIAGVGAPIRPGGLSEARRRIDRGMSAAKITEALGKPSFSFGTEGTSTHEIWTYYFADGVLTINLTDGYSARVAAEFGPPRVPTSSRR